MSVVQNKNLKTILWGRRRDEQNDRSTGWEILQEPEKVDLNSAEYTARFAEASIYEKKAKIEAVQITQEGLESGEYADEDIRLDGDEYVIDTYVMRERDGDVWRS